MLLMDSKMTVSSSNFNYMTYGNYSVSLSGGAGRLKVSFSGTKASELF
jgi:hypothetical protein